MRLSKAAYLKKKDLKPEEVDIGDGDTVAVRKLSARARAELERRYATKKPEDDPEGFRWALIKRCVLDDGGKLMFEDADKDEVMEMQADLIEKVFVACARVNAFTEKDVETLEKK